MRFLCISDLHLSMRRPIGRLDNYWQTQKEKLGYIFEFANSYCDYYLCGGDVFDRGTVENEVEVFLLDNIPTGKFITACGQHDMNARRIDDSCSIVLLEKAKKFSLCPKKITDNIKVYCCHYGQQIPNIEDNDQFNILLIHTMVSDKDYWNGNVKWISPKWFFRNTKFDLIVSGDNHATFHVNKGNRWLLNSGSMLRKSIVQHDHKPCFYTFDTETFEVEQISIPHKDFNEVMKVDEYTLKKEKEFNDAMWRSELGRKDIDLNVNFEENLRKEAEETNDNEIVDIINQCIDGNK